MSRLINLRTKLIDRHIFQMTDDTGMIQHAVNGVPDPSTGYTTDDNARALIMAALLYERYPEARYHRLLYRYLSFLLYAQSSDGWFRNFMGYDRRFLEDRGSEDCFGRCLWALGFVIANESLPADIRRTASHILHKALPNCERLRYPRGEAYAVIGLSQLEFPEAAPHLQRLLNSLADRYEKTRDQDWHWFEEELTYSNAVLPWAMLCGYRLTKEERYKTIGLESLAFLERHTFINGYFKPIGCKGWFKKGQKPAAYDEQPVEAAETLLCFLEAYKLTKDEHFLGQARRCYKWYEGQNSKGISLIDPETGGCYDGLTEDGINHNQGAESIVSYFIARLAITRNNFTEPYTDPALIDELF